MKYHVIATRLHNFLHQGFPVEELRLNLAILPTMFLPWLYTIHYLRLLDTLAKLTCNLFNQITIVCIREYKGVLGCSGLLFSFIAHGFPGPVILNHVLQSV